MSGQVKKFASIQSSTGKLPIKRTALEMEVANTQDENSNSPPPVAMEDEDRGNNSSIAQHENPRGSSMIIDAAKQRESSEENSSKSWQNQVTQSGGMLEASLTEHVAHRNFFQGILSLTLRT